MNPSPRVFNLPPAVSQLVSARNALRNHYRATGLTFTLDGKIVGDIGEAIAHEIFGIKLTSKRLEGIDGHSVDGSSIQVKATGTDKGGPAFRRIDEGNRADFLLFFRLDFESGKVEVAFNGPERLALAELPDGWKGQRALTLNQIRKADAKVRDEDRLPVIGAI